MSIQVDPDWWQSREEDDPILGLDRPLNVRIMVSRAGSRYVMEGGLSGGLLLRCDRCLEAYHRDLAYDFRLFLALPSEDSGMDEVELKEEDLDVDFIRGEEIDLDEIVKEQIYFTLPIKSLCRETCSGLCPVCGANLNMEVCECPQEKGHPGFSKLKGLKIRGE